MDLSVEEYIEDYRSKQNIIDKLNEDIREIEEMIELLRTIVKEKKEKLGSFGNKIVASVRLGDLLEELSKLTKIPVNDIYYEINTDIWANGTHGKNYFYDKKDSAGLSLTISSKESHSAREIKDCLFYYDFIYFHTNFDEIQADGRPLIDHCDTVIHHYDDMPWKARYTALELKNTRDLDIICSFSLYDLADLNEYPFFHPRDLLKTAILNCIAKNKTVENDSSNKVIKKKIFGIF